MIDFEVAGAVYSLLTYGDREPLARLVESGNDAVFRYQPARRILADMVRDDFKNGTKKSSPEAQSRRQRLVGAVAILHGLSPEKVPIKNNPNTARKTCACRIVGKLVAHAEIKVT